MLTTVELLRWLEVVLMVVVGVPLSLSSIITLRKDWNKVYIVKRKQLFVLILTVLTIYPLFIFTPLVVSFNIGSMWIDILNYVIYTHLYITYWLVTSRFWMYYFDCQLIKFHKNKHWRVAIDPINETSNWFVKNKNKWGNEYFLLKIIVCISIAQESIFFMLFEFLKNNDDRKHVILIDGTLNLILPFIISIYLFIFHFGNELKHFQFFDNLGIGREIIVTTIVTILFVFGTNIFWLLFLFTLNSYYYVIAEYLFIISRLVLIYLVAIYPKKLFNQFNINDGNDGISKRKKKKRSFMKKVFGLSGTMEESLLISSDHDSNSINSNSDFSYGIDIINANENRRARVSWKKIISTYNGYFSIFQHLEKEFSIENLLFLQEVKLIIN